VTPFSTGATSSGPAVPSASAAVAHRPVPADGVRLTAGLLHQWQLRNKDASLPLALKQLEAAGNLSNLRLALSGGTAGYRGPVFMDSDVYKTLEAVSWELGRTPDAGLASFAAETTALLAAAQQPDGYLNSYVQVHRTPRYARLESSHELYCAGHLIQAAVAASRTFDGGALLAVARRFADHLVKVFLGSQAGLDGHPVVETALVELYRQTGADEYLELARQFIDQRGHGRIGDSGFGSRYLQDATPVRDYQALAGHAVRALYLESGVVDVAVETGDTALLESSRRRWTDMVATKTALTAGNGSRHSGEAFGDAFELPPDRAYNETCAAIGSFHWSWRLLLATGDARYADLMERIVFNGFAAATATDGQRFFYVNPLQRRADHFEDDDPGRRREWFSCACCPPNIMRLFASLQHYLATVSGDALYLHQFTGASVTAPVAAGSLGLDVATGYPWDGLVTVTVTEAPAADCGLALRIPDWSRDPTVTLNGAPAGPATDEHGYLVIRRRWQPGDTVALSLDIAPRLTHPATRADALRGTAAVERGPLVYCFEQADQPAGLNIEDLALRPGTLTEAAGPVPGVGHTVMVGATATHLSADSQHGLPYRSEPAPRDGTPAIARALPYFQWDNRDGRAMRVWMPLSRPDDVPAAPTDAVPGRVQPHSENT
jgi:DUF1680 family protein